MIETPRSNLSRGMRQLNGIYTQRFNRTHGRVGHVFQGRFKSIVVDRDAYLLELSRYIVRNPVAAGMVKDVGDWPWSSYLATAGEVSSPAFLDVGWLLSRFGSVAETAKAAYVAFVRDEQTTSLWDQLNGPDILGDDLFRGRLQAAGSGATVGIPKRKQLLRHLPLSDIARPDRERGDWIREAYREHGYTMQEIATYCCLHHSTVSRIIKSADENAQNES